MNTPAIFSSDHGTDVSSSYQQHRENKLFCSICPFPLPFIEHVAFRLYYPLGEILFYWTVFVPGNTWGPGTKAASTMTEGHTRACSMRPFVQGLSCTPCICVPTPCICVPMGVCEVGARGVLFYWGPNTGMTQPFRSVRVVTGRLIILEAVGAVCKRLALFF